MFVLRMIILIALTGYSYGMGQTPANQLNEFGTFVSASFFLLAPVLSSTPCMKPISISNLTSSQSSLSTCF